MLIHLKASYSILGEIPTTKGSIFSFAVPIDDKSEVVVQLRPSEKSVESLLDVDVSDKLWTTLQSDIHDANMLSKDLQQELAQVTNGLSAATRKVLSLIKYNLFVSGMSENLASIRGDYRSIDRTHWKRMPMAFTAILDVQDLMPLDEKTAPDIQRYIENNFEPFLSLRHLHRSREESDPRYKWIDATIAAELAIKEFLIKKCPAVERILLDVQAPPLDKLYGSILKDCAKEESPNKKAIKNGAEIRNALVHKPLKTYIDAQDATSYYREIQMAIYHLLTYYIQLILSLATSLNPRNRTETKKLLERWLK
jgi:hypothetical protein